jgi:hypothetical protein
MQLLTRSPEVKRLKGGGNLSATQHETAVRSRPRGEAKNEEEDEGEEGSDYEGKVLMICWLSKRQSDLRIAV